MSTSTRKKTPKTTRDAVVEVTARQLRDLLTPVLPLTDKGDTLPILECIWLRGHGEHGITAAATDRYRMGICRDRGVAAPDGFEALLPWRAAKAILGMFKPNRHIDPELKLTFSADVLTVETGGGLTEMISGARVQYRLGVGEYPRLDTVLAKALKGDGVPGATGFSPALLADFKLAVRDADPMILHGSGSPLQPVGVTIGDYFAGALMPVRVATPDGLADPIEAWRDVVDLTIPNTTADDGKVA